MGADARRGESLIENIVNEAMHDILESADFDKLLDDCTSSRAGLYLHAINNEAEPEAEEAFKSEKPDSEEETAHAVYEKHLREVTGVEEDELFRKRMFMQEPFVELMEFMLEDTMFNLMEEATYEEFDLTQPPKIYIRKDMWARGHFGTWHSELTVAVVRTSRYTSASTEGAWRWATCGMCLVMQKY